ncbi:MAG: dihydrolipoyl dehydrogenase [Pseudomonadota bacterium]
MNTKNVDVAIIGAGSAGLNARREVEKAGGSWVLIESGAYGTTCARVGCMPSKLLIAAADVAHQVSNAGKFGIQAQNFSIDGEAVLSRVRNERDRFVGFVVEDTRALPEEHRVIGHARFVGATILDVDGHTRINAKSVVIATGSSPYISAPYDTIREHVMVNDDVFSLQSLPQSIAVIGTGIIGLEIGIALTRLGVRTAIFSASGRLGPFTDPALKTTVADILGAELDLRLSTSINQAEFSQDKIVLNWSDRETGHHTETFDKILVAAGRRPNIFDLNLEAAGVMLDDHGRLDWNPQTTQIGNLPIFVAGDASGHRPLLHEASDEGRIAGSNSMLYPNVRSHVRRTPLAIAFTDPQMALFGKTFAELDVDSLAIGEINYASQGRARVMGENKGLVRLYADRRNCQLVGGEMLGPRVEHTAHLLAWATQQQMTVQKLLEMPFYHPVIEEGIRTALRDLADKLKVTGDCRCEDMAEAPGT